MSFSLFRRGERKVTLFFNNGREGICIFAKRGRRGEEGVCRGEEKVFLILEGTREGVSCCCEEAKEKSICFEQGMRRVSLF